MHVGISTFAPLRKNSISGEHFRAFVGKAGYITMLITRIELENIKSYRQFKVDLRRGTTAISGANGAGKTTLVEAIGFALFDYLPYKHEQFIREGAKFGRVVIHLIGGDDRPYIVERRCGSGGRWQVNDVEADARLEQRADVSDKLHDLFGIDRERPLDSLFRDALGVPQGTFTSIFLETPSRRKQTFDALLQIEDYKTAADGLLETQRIYKEQMQDQQAEIQRLGYETRELEDWRKQLQQARLEDEQQKQQNVLWSQQRTAYEERVTILSEQQMRLQHLHMQFDTSSNTYNLALKLLSEREQHLQNARAASQVIASCENDYQRHEQANTALQHLSQQARQRDQMRVQQAQARGELQTSDESMANWQHRLDEVATARRTIVDLAPLVEQQIMMEKQRDEAMQSVERYKTILAEGKRLKQQLTKVQQDQEGLVQQISKIEPLVPLAELLHERQEVLTQARISASESSTRHQQLQEKLNLLREKQSEREHTAELLRKAERNLEIIEEHRSEAEEVPRLKTRIDELAAKKFWLEGNIAGYKKSRAQSAGGQCPLLHETCLNIKQRGIVSLEFYFDNLLKDEYEQLEQITQQQSAVNERINQIKKYADALGDLGKYVERRDTLADRLQNIAIEISRLDREVTALKQGLETLEQLEQRVKSAEIDCKESEQADARVRKLDGLRRQLQQLQAQAEQYESNLQERRRELDDLRDSEARLHTCTTDLAALGDPRAQSKIQQNIIAQENTFQSKLQTEQQRRSTILSQIEQLREQISVYQTLDAEIEAQKALSQDTHAGHQNYLTHINEARLLPSRETAYNEQVSETKQAEQALRAAENAYNVSRATFDEQELERLKSELTRLQQNLASLAQTMKHQQEHMNDLTQNIARAEALLTQLEAAQKEHQELNDLFTMIEQFRRLIKEAAPYVLKAMLNDISAESNRIFGEIMGDRSAQLSWQNDYEISLRRQGVARSFAQLSGGEQMSAALAVRLALLKKLSTLNLAFFDEPTQNMDELRRMNLAEQIRRVRGFDQLLVISHDDTFEQGLDSLVRLNKEQGETILVNDDDSLESFNPERATV